eukprot:675777-Ditylum_brightwellii.AAC.1
MNKLHTAKHGSIKEDLLALASQDHPNFTKDNSTVYYKLEEATRGTQYTLSIKPYQRRKNGRSAWLALTSQFAGKGKWEKLLKESDDIIHNRCWKGIGNYRLE